MCGRYTVFTEDEMVEIRSIIQEVSRKFGNGVVNSGEIFPTNTAPILTFGEGGIAPYPIKWGFPRWDGKGVIINARSESALEKTMFSKLLLHRRCIIPSTGFYEWAAFSTVDPQISLFENEPTLKNKKEHKTKLLFRIPSKPMLYMAGMIGTFMGKDGKPEDAFVVLTTAANASMSPFHDRMPVILSINEHEQWIHDDSFMREVLVREGAELEWQIAG